MNTKLPDIEKCEIRQPEKEESLQLYNMLGEIFPVETKLFQSIAQGKMSIYKWEPYSLFWNDEIIGNVSIHKYKIWWYNSPLDIVGYASVATPEKYRKMGIAKKLMTHCINIADSEGKPSILFASVPVVYEKLGFQLVPQNYKKINAKQLPSVKYNKEDIRLITNLDENVFGKLNNVYENIYPNYNGKLIREEGFEKSRTYFFNNAEVCKTLALYSDKEIKAYVTFDEDTVNNSAAIIEFCVAEDDEKSIEILLNTVSNRLPSPGGKINLHLTAEHSAFKFLASSNVDLQNAGNGNFMVRQTPENKVSGLENLFWSKADEF